MKDSPPLEGWRKFGRIFDGVVLIITSDVFVYDFTTPSSPFGRIHPSGGGEFCDGYFTHIYNVQQ